MKKILRQNIKICDFQKTNNSSDDINKLKKNLTCIIKNLSANNLANEDLMAILALFVYEIIITNLNINISIGQSFNYNKKTDKVKIQKDLYDYYLKLQIDYIDLCNVVNEGKQPINIKDIKNINGIITVPPLEYIEITIDNFKTLMFKYITKIKKCSIDKFIIKCDNNNCEKI